MCFVMQYKKHRDIIFVFKKEGRHFLLKNNLMAQSYHPPTPISFHYEVTLSEHAMHAMVEGMTNMFFTFLSAGCLAFNGSPQTDIS